MQFLRKRWIPVLCVLVLLSGSVAWYARSGSAATSDSSEIIVPVKKGDFVVPVTTSGELRARKFVEIQAPVDAQQAEIYQMKLQTLVPEGTVVKAGDIVAELDRGAVASKVAEVQLALTKAQAEQTQAQLDSTLTLSQAREDIRGLELSLEEKKIARDQAQYEAPSLKRQAEIDFERADRGLTQAKTNYTTKVAQAVAKMAEVTTEVDRQQNKMKMVQMVQNEFTIKAPDGGMVIYARDWSGRKKAVGSQVTPWDPTVATLPDLSQMEAVTYVNEVDVKKIAVGQSVQISLDADPTKKLDGSVAAVANVGEQRPNSDAKVFEVKVTVMKADTTLRPGMTTSTAIETSRVHDALSVPLDAVTNDGPTQYVYAYDGPRLVRKQIQTGAMNDNEIIVLRGLQKGDRVLLSSPNDKTAIPTIKLP